MARKVEDEELMCYCEEGQRVVHSACDDARGIVSLHAVGDAFLCLPEAGGGEGGGCGE